ncbi:serine/threonine-protein kinase [Spirillospora sp. NPDC047279]|uniref:serine/threonine-protein kinase n=1 Tax=Spirillospora sp. NPDC047279 TaxID=3155478 RepID=UPI0033E8E410
MNAPAWRIPFLTELRELGSGAQGRVVLARDDASGEVVAVKYLSRDLLGNTGARATFRAEARMLTRVRDPHVAQMRGYVETTEGAAIVMEAVHGQSLRLLLDERRSLRPEASLTILKGSLLGMAAAHAVGVVHRDYKPANVMVQDDGTSKLIDFGVAVLAGESTVMGTPAYMAPEQWQGGPASPSTDVYAATVVFFECVTGRKPFSATTTDGLMREHLGSAVPLDGIPEALRPLVLRGTAKDPGLRFGGITEFVGLLETSAAAAYGADWERRGLATLGGSVALFAAAFPLSLLGGGASTTGTAATAGSVASTAGTAGTLGGTSGAGAAGSGAVTTTTGGVGHSAGGQGVIGKIGGAKGVAGGTTAVAGAVAVAVLLWPSGPTVGGEAQGNLRAYFTRPGLLVGQPNMPAAETPYVTLDYKVTPAKIKPGTRVSVTQRFYSRFVVGARYLPGGKRECFGDKTKRADAIRSYGYSLGGQGTEGLGKNQYPVWFFRTSKAAGGKLPSERGVFVTGRSRQTANSEPYSWQDCAFQSTHTSVTTITLPDTDEIPPGRYRVALLYPLGFTKIKGRDAGTTLESVGPRAEGSLPVVEVFWD